MITVDELDVRLKKEFYYNNNIYSIIVIENKNKSDTLFNAGLRIEPLLRDLNNTDSSIREKKSKLRFYYKILETSDDSPNIEFGTTKFKQIPENKDIKLNQNLPPNKTISIVMKRKKDKYDNVLINYCKDNNLRFSGILSCDINVFGDTTN